LQRRVKQAGGRWNSAKRVWEIYYDQAAALGLKKRIVKPEVSDIKHYQVSDTRHSHLVAVILRGITMIHIFPRKDLTMPEITVTLVDRTGVASQSHENFKAGIMHELEDILGDLLYSNSDITVVNARWVSQSPAAGDQDLVIHWVPDRDHSYLRQIWPSTVIAQNAGGHTHQHGNTTGSEFYRIPKLKTTGDYAKIAAHEAMHNITGLNNRQLHGQLGLAGDAGGTPHLPVTPNDRTLTQAGMQRGLPNQLL